MDYGIKVYPSKLILILLLIKMVCGLQTHMVPQDISNLQLSSDQQLGSSLEKRLKKFLSINKQLEAQEKAQPHSLKDIHTSAETLGNLTMDELLAIAKRNPAPGMKPMDRVILFLQQEQKLLKEEQEMKRQEAIREIVAEQNAQREAERIQKAQKLAQIDSQQLLKTKNMLAEAMKAPSTEPLVQPQNLVQTQVSIEEAQLSQSKNQVYQNQKQKVVQKVNDQDVENLKSVLRSKINQENAESVNIEDNLSISEIIAQKYKKQVKVKKLKTPEEAAQILIKDTKQFNVNAEEYTEGTPQEQAELAKKLGKIETDLAASWKDLSLVKQNLWNKLHQVKDDVKANIASQLNNLAQTLPNKPKMDQRPIQFAQKVEKRHQPSLFKLFQVKLYEVDTIIVIVVIVLAAILICCCVMYWCACCWVSSEAKKAQKEQMEAYEKLVEEQKQKKMMEALAAEAAKE